MSKVSRKELQGLIRADLTPGAKYDQRRVKWY